MTYYVCFNEMLLDEAYKPAQVRGKKSDVKATDDLYVVDKVIAGNAGCIDIYALDERLRREYETIEQLENKESEYAFGDNNRVSEVCSESERMISRLKSDKHGILADILIKHGRMKYVEEMYKKMRK